MSKKVLAKELIERHLKTDMSVKNYPVIAAQGLQVESLRPKTMQRERSIVSRRRNILQTLSSNKYAQQSTDNLSTAHK